MNNETNKYFLPAAVVLGCLFIAGAVIWNNSHPGTGTTSTTPTATAVNIKDVKTDGEPFLGDANARHDR